MPAAGHSDPERNPRPGRRVITISAGIRGTEARAEVVIAPAQSAAGQGHTVAGHLSVSAKEQSRCALFYCKGLFIFRAEATLRVPSPPHETSRNLPESGESPAISEGPAGSGRGPAGPYAAPIPTHPTANDLDRDGRGVRARGRGKGWGVVPCAPRHLVGSLARPRATSAAPRSHSGTQWGRWRRSL